MAIGFPSAARVGVAGISVETGAAVGRTKVETIKGAGSVFVAGGWLAAETGPEQAVRKSNKAKAAFRICNRQNKAEVPYPQEPPLWRIK
jgi:hypothetical protein